MGCLISSGTGDQNTRGRVIVAAAQSRASRFLGAGEGGCLSRSLYTDCLYEGYRPFSEKCEDEKEGVKSREKTPGKRAPKCKTPEVGA